MTDEGAMACQYQVLEELGSMQYQDSPLTLITIIDVSQVGALVLCSKPLKKPQVISLRSNMYAKRGQPEGC